MRSRHQLPMAKSREVLTPANQERLTEGRLRERETWNGAETTTNTSRRGDPVSCIPTNCRGKQSRLCEKKNRRGEDADIDRVEEETIKKLSWRKRGRTGSLQKNKYTVANKYNVLYCYCVCNCFNFFKHRRKQATSRSARQQILEQLAYSPIHSVTR